MRDQRAPTTHQPPNQPLPLSSLKAGLKTWRWLGRGRPLTQPYPTLVKVPPPARIWGRTVSAGLRLSWLGVFAEQARVCYPGSVVYTPPPTHCTRFPDIRVKGRAEIWWRMTRAGRGSGCPPLRWALMGSGVAPPPLRSLSARLEVVTSPNPEKCSLLQCRWRCWQWLVGSLETLLYQNVQWKTHELQWT